MREPDELDLELLHLGAIDDPARAAQIEAAAAGPLAAAAEELRAYAAYWKAHRPPLPLPEAPTASPWWRSRGLVVAAMAALVLLALMSPLQPTRQDGVRSMGGLPVDVLPTRDGELLPDGLHRLHDGDELRLSLTPPADGYLDIATVEEDGRVSLLVVGQRVRAGERFALAGAIRLDDTTQREWLVVELVERPRSAAAAEAAFRDLLPQPSPSPSTHRWVQEVTRRP